MSDWLPTTAYAVLGLLSFDEEFSGYQIHRRAHASLKHFFWSPAMSQIYTELRRLEGLGLVIVLTREADDIRVKRRYRITEQGKRELARWVAEGPHDPPNVLKNLTCLRTFYGHLIEPAQLVATAEAHRLWAERGRAELQQTHVAVEARSHQDPRWRYAALVVEWGLEYYQTEAAAASRLVERLEAMATEGSG